MASPLVTFLENYDWKGYTVDTIVNNSNTMMYLHRGNFPMHRHCKNTDGNWVCAFNLLEAWHGFTWKSGMSYGLMTTRGSHRTQMS